MIQATSMTVIAMPMTSASVTVPIKPGDGTTVYVMHIREYISMCIYVYITHVYIDINMSMCIYIYLYTYMYVYICVLRSCMCITHAKTKHSCIHTYIHTICAYVYTDVCMQEVRAHTC